MSYPLFNPYYNNSPYVGATYQNYGLNQQPQRTQITGYNLIPVSSKEEATGTQVDLINGTPTFFYNKSTNKFYIKQFDIKNGLPIFKTYTEIKQPVEEQSKPLNYDKEFNYLCNGIDSLHKMLANLLGSDEEEPEKKTVKKKEVK